MSELFEIIDGKVIVTTSTGWKVECLPYGDDLMRAGTALALPDKPDPPTYLLGEPEEGEREIYVPYTDESIKDEKTPAEDTEAWGLYLPKRQAYIQEVAVIQTQQSLMRSRVMVHRATRILDLPDLHNWAAEREAFYGIPALADDRELLFQFFTTEVSKTENDVLMLMAGIMRATGVSEEVLDAFESNFRDSLGTPEGTDTEEDSKGTSTAAQEGTQRLVDGAVVEST